MGLWPEINLPLSHPPTPYHTLHSWVNNIDDIITHTSSDIMVYPMTISDKTKDTASKNRNNKFILDALNGLMDGRQFMTTLACKKQGIVQASSSWLSLL